MLIDRAPSEKIKIGLIVGAIVLIIVAVILAKLREAAKKNETLHRMVDGAPVFRLGKFAMGAPNAFVAVLIAVALFATANYTSYGEVLESDHYDSRNLLEQYVGAKYFDELGYDWLNAALIVADEEGNRFCRDKLDRYMAKSNGTYRKRDLSHALEQRELIRDRFSASRWKQFVHDVSHLQRKYENLSCRAWRQLLREEGFNGSPARTFLLGTLANWTPVEQVKWLTHIDMVLVLVGLAAVAWAFGLQTMVLAWLFLCVSFTLRLNHIGSSFLQYDWVVALLVGIACIKKEKAWLAGFFLGYATAMNYACAFWMLGLLAKTVHSLLVRKEVPLRRFWKRIPAEHGKTLLSFVATVFLLAASATLRYGVETQGDSFQYATAIKELKARDVALVVATAYRGETDAPSLTRAKVRLINNSRGIVAGVGIVLTLLLGLFLTHTRTFYAVGLGALPYFWIFLTPFDFFVCLVVSVVIHAQDLTRGRNLFGLLIIFLMELFTNASQHLNMGESYFLISNMAVLMAIYTLGGLAFLGVDWWKHRDRAKSKVGKA